ncbi:MAG TPA: hypothetical protein VGN25_04940 [Solirubrobacteraceae bacterium]|jgi:hypothetical protein|nr:hypothetical protein [Solirubrobacteraceae bacterium]
MSDDRTDSTDRCMVLGYDRSDDSRAAARWAVSELLPDGKLVIVHADRPLHAPPSPLSNANERAELGRAIVIGGRTHSRLHRPIGVVTVELLSRSPVPVIAVPLDV